MIKKNNVIKIAILSFLFVVTFIFYQYNRTDPVISLSVSTDGRYVISAHAARDAHPFYPKGKLVLWDIEKKEKKILSDNVNAYSAKFIPDSYEFMWQDAQGVVHIQNVDGKELEKFSHFWLIGQLMSVNKDFYLSADKYGHLYKGYGANMIPVYTDGGTGIPLTLSMSENYFLSASNSYLPENAPVAEIDSTVNPINPNSSKTFSYTGVVLWDRHTLKPTAILRGNVGKTTGLISPDGKWVVTGGENFRNYMWSIDDVNKRLELERVDDSVIYRKPLEPNKQHPIPVPKKYDGKQITLNHTVAISFLTEKDFVLFNKSNADELVPLYTVGSPFIKGYVETGKPYVSTDYYERNLSVSSAPKAHILVTGQATGGGINVYKYHPDKMELEKIWVAD